MNAIPGKWKNWLSNIDNNRHVTLDDDICIYNLRTYNTSLREIRQKLSKELGRNKNKLWVKDFWRKKINIELDKNIWNIAYEVTKESRLRELHWKIVHNIYPTNIMLSK